MHRRIGQQLNEIGIHVLAAHETRDWTGNADSERIVRAFLGGRSHGGEHKMSDLIAKTERITWAGPIVAVWEPEEALCAALKTFAEGDHRPFRRTVERVFRGWRWRSVCLGWEGVVEEAAEEAGKAIEAGRLYGRILRHIGDRDGDKRPPLAARLLETRRKAGAELGAEVEALMEP